MAQSVYGGVVAGVKDFMDLRASQQAIETNETQEKAAKQQQAILDMKFQEEQEAKEKRKKRLPLSSYSSVLQAMPSAAEHFIKIGESTGDISTDPITGEKTISAEGYDNILGLFDKDTKLGQEMVKRTYADLSNQILTLTEQKQQAKKPEDVQAIDQKIKALDEHRITILNSDFDLQKDIAKTQAKPEKESWSLSHKLGNNTPVWTSTTGRAKVGDVNGPDYNAKTHGGMFAVNTPQVSPTAIYIQDNKDKAATEVTDDALALAANQFLQTGTMPALGMGNAGLRMKVLNKAGELARASGIEPSQVPALQAEFNANKQALKTLTNSTASFGAFESGMLKNAKYAESLAKTVYKSGLPPVDAVINAIRTKTGDPNIVRYGNAIYAAALEYEKIRTAGTNITSAELSIGAQKKAEELINTAQSEAQLKAGFEAMRVDARNIMTSRKDEVAKLKQGLSAWGGSGQPKTRDISKATSYLNGATSRNDAIGRIKALAKKGWTREELLQIEQGAKKWD